MSWAWRWWSRGWRPPIRPNRRVAWVSISRRATISRGPLRWTNCCRHKLPDAAASAALVLGAAARISSATFIFGRPSGFRLEDLVISTEKQDRRNEEINVPRVRVIGSDGAQIGVIPTREAIAMAVAEGLELVEISPNAEPPVCKIMDYGKFLYQKDKQQQAARKKQKQIQIKEMKFRPGTEEADYNTKLRQI
ncbi:MAG: translation initiation factor IF-3, partial [Nevskiaceae bacterium]